MPDSRRARRIADPGLQPERTSLAWLRTLLGYGALVALALRQKGPEAGVWLWGVLAVLALVLLLLWRYARQRNLMDVAIADFTSAAHRPGGGGAVAAVYRRPPAYPVCAAGLNRLLVLRFTRGERQPAE